MDSKIIFSITFLLMNINDNLFEHADALYQEFFSPKSETDKVNTKFQ